MPKKVRIIVLCAALAILFLVGSQFYSQNEKSKVEDESAALAQQVLALCHNSDPATVEKLTTAGVCANAVVVNEPGARGEVGPAGPPGRDGTDGKDGKDGQTVIGPPGPAGADGQTVIGPPGEPGADGQTITGPPGADGKDGQAGPPGPAGPPGADGSDGVDGQPGRDGADGRTPTQMTCTPTGGLGSDQWDCTVTAWETSN